MIEASPFLQQLVRLFAYGDFVRTVAEYFEEASQYNQHHFLLFDGYTILQDRWPASGYSPIQVRPLLTFLTMKLTKRNYYQFYDHVQKTVPRVHPIRLGHGKYWFDEFNMKQDRRNRVSSYSLMVTSLEACTNLREKALFPGVCLSLGPWFSYLPPGRDS